MEAAGRERTDGRTTAIALIRLGIACGLFTCIGYPVLVFVPLPRVATVALAALFALAMLRHPRFGPLIAFPGLLVAATLLVLNLATFPTPPGEAGSIDVGPLVGLWYLAVTIQLWRSLPWYLRQASSPESATLVTNEGG